MAQSSRRRNPRQRELPFGCRGEAPRAGGGEQAIAAAADREGPVARLIMERVVERENMIAAWKRVKQNGGGPGVDGLDIVATTAWMRAHWPTVREQLLAGTYQPQPVRRVAIPKPGGKGERELGIPTVLDRLIQQAILQVLQPAFDPTFSAHSYGFRPKRSAHQAVEAARRYIEGEARRWVVDVDLEKFFDRVNHDVLMGRLATRLEDRRILGLIRRYLNAGMLADGVAIERHEGTPQGGPLSPLLANLLLDEVDKELENRGHAFVRYADDLRVFVRSKRAGQRVMRSLTRLFGRLKLRVNESKSAVALAWTRPFLGFAFWWSRGGVLRVRAARESIATMKDRVRSLTRRTIGRTLSSVVQDLRRYLLGWRAYFRLADTRRIFADLDQWIRRRLRAIQLKQWKRGRTAFRELRARGVPYPTAVGIARHARHWWRAATGLLNVALPASHFDQLGLPHLAD